jgi:chemotaxis protein histidine kinase CheA
MDYELPEEFINQFEILKKNYRDKLPQTIDDLAISMNNFNLDPDIETLKKLYVQIHNLSGSSGMYGFSEITVKSRDFELLIKPFVENKIMPTQENIIQIEEKFKEYKEFLNSSIIN